MTRMAIKAYNVLKERYMNSEVVMAEFLASEIVPEGELSYEDAFEIYAALMKFANGDKVYIEKEGEMIEV